MSKLIRNFVLLTTTFAAASSAQAPLDYRLLATTKTSTMEKELNQAATDGYRFSRLMGGKTAVGGQEVTIAMVRDAGPASGAKSVTYRLLATSRTSTMQKELQQLADEGYEYRDQTVFASAFGGSEVVVIMERGAGAGVPSSYRVLATSKTSTMEKELNAAAGQGYHLIGFTVGKTAIGGDELVAIVKKI